MVDYIDKKIISLVVEIIFMSFILVVTYIIWGKIDLSKLEIGNYLINHSPRGVTKIDGVGMYSKLDKGILMTVVKAGQLNELKEMVSAIDSKAFVIVSDTSEVLGNGFKEIKNEDMLAHEKSFKMKKK